jgi:UDP-N-acetylglucosamine pyrophosphorylase
MSAPFGPYESKMKTEGLSASAIAAFKHAFGELTSGTAQPIDESTISPVASLPSLADDISGKFSINKDLLDQSVVLKLNGGLGTSMGLDKAKSLLPVKGQDTFLDLTSKQIMSMRASLDSNVRFMLMNSFNTSTDTMEFLTKYPALGSPRYDGHQMPPLHRPLH